jgi:hypothetical protein
MLALVFLLAATVWPGASYGLTDDEAIEAGREGLSRPVRYPWYEKQTDDVRRVKADPPPPPPTAGQWEWEGPKSKARRRPRLGLWDILGEILLYLGFAVLIGGLALIIMLLIRTFLRSEANPARSQQKAIIGTDDDVDRVEALPFKVRRPRGDLLEEARRHYQAGNYNEAIIYFYSYLLVELDKSQLIRLTRGKTNRQYLREIRRQPLLFELLEKTMIAFEDVFFGHHSLDRSRFETCFNRLDEFEARIEEAAA